MMGRSLAFRANGAPRRGEAGPLRETLARAEVRRLSSRTGAVPRTGTAAEAPSGLRVPGGSHGKHGAAEK